MEWFNWALSINDALTTRVTSQVITIALVVAAINFICCMGYNYAKHGIENFLTSDGNKFPDYMMIAKGIVIIFCITLYLPIAKTLVGTMEVINQATAMDSSYQGQFQEYATKFLDMQKVDSQETMDRALEEEAKYGPQSGYAIEEIDKQKSAEQKDEIFSLKEIINTLNPMNWVANGIHVLAGLIYQLIKIVIIGITTILMKVLVIVGPLAFAFSILPVFSKQLEQWFGTLLTTGFVFTTLNILDMISFQVVEQITNADKSLAESADVAFSTLTIDLVLIFVYCSCFWLTSKYVGRGDAGRVISKMMTTATALTALTISNQAAAGGKGANQLTNNSNGNNGNNNTSNNSGK